MFFSRQDGSQPYCFSYNKEPEINAVDINTIVGLARMAECLSCDFIFFKEQFESYFNEIKKDICKSNVTPLFQKILEEALSVKHQDDDRTGDDERAPFYEDIIVWMIKNLNVNLVDSYNGVNDDTYSIKSGILFETFFIQIGFLNAKKSILEGIKKPKENAQDNKKEEQENLDGGAYQATEEEKEFIFLQHMTTNQALKIIGTVSKNDLERVRRAYLLRSKEKHPDKGGNTEEFQQVMVAYEYLKTRHEQRERRKQQAARYKR